MGRNWARLVLIAATLGVTVPVRSEEEGMKLPEWLERTKISGYVFGDAYYFVSHDDPMNFHSSLVGERYGEGLQATGI